MQLFIALNDHKHVHILYISKSFHVFVLQDTVRLPSEEAHFNGNHRFILDFSLKYENWLKDSSTKILHRAMVVPFDLNPFQSL